jgi:peptidyl-prolyl cis-trans isomerase B (cyclophilin B)
MKIFITIGIILIVIIGGYFLFRGIGNNPESSPSPTASSTPEPSPTPTSTPVPTLPFSLLPDNLTKVSATISTAKGNIQLELYPKIAPLTVANFIYLANSGFYNGTKFHRVVADFVIQGGDPLSKTDDPKVGSGGPGYLFADEINPKVQGLDDASIKALEALGYKYSSNLQSLPVTIGVIAMANAGPNTNGSQFFIVTTKNQPGLNGKHAVFGKVVKGMDVVKKIIQGDKITKITTDYKPSASTTPSVSPTISPGPTSTKTPTPSN